MKKKGFTLVELIVVLVILAILAAIMIPALVGWIDKAKQKQVLLEARQVVQAADAAGYECYGKGEAVPTSIADGDAIWTLAKIPTGSKVTELTWTDDKTPPVTKLVYTSAAGVVVTYENGVYTIGETTTNPASSFSDKTTMEEIKKLVTTEMDSAAAGVAGSKAADFVKSVKDSLGIDLSQIATWKVTNGSGDYNNKLYWTPQDIQSMNVGDHVYVMSYNFKSGTYTLRQMTVAAGTSYSEGKMVLSANGDKMITTEQDTSKQTYDQMMKDYAAATTGQ